MKEILRDEYRVQAVTVMNVYRIPFGFQIAPKGVDGLSINAEHTAEAIPVAQAELIYGR